MTIEPAAALHGRTRPERERLRREAALDKTIEQSFPASDPPSTDPNPDSDPETHSETNQRGDHIMNIQHYKQRLLDLDKTLSARIARETDEGRGAFIDSAHDSGDASVADEVASEEFTEAEHDAEVLQQVRDALGRVEDGTFGRCIVDNGPIEEQRLEAEPWTPYCLKHAQRLEAAAASKTPTL